MLRHEAETLEERFDDAPGPHARRWACAQLLPETRSLRRAMSRGVPWVEAILLPVIMPLVRSLVRKLLRVTSESAHRPIGRVRGIFREVDERLGDRRRVLVGERIARFDQKAQHLHWRD